MIAVVAAGAAAAVVPQLSAGSAARFEATHEPKAAADFASVHLSGRRLYSIDTWGGYLAGRFPGGRIVFLYDEAGVFGSAALQTYLDVHDLRHDWTSVISDYGIGDAILPDGSQEVAALLTVGWSFDCRDTASGSVVMSLAGGGGSTAELGTAPACT
jgi:hypothetical protein